jgi:hypothetical protein
MSALASRNIVSPCFIYNGVLMRHLPDNLTGYPAGNPDQIGDGFAADFRELYAFSR